MENNGVAVQSAPQELVSSCSECSREINADGTPNVNGAVFRTERTKILVDGSCSLDCLNCPVRLAMSDDEREYILRAMD